MRHNDRETYDRIELERHADHKRIQRDDGVIQILTDVTVNVEENL